MACLHDENKNDSTVCEHENSLPEQLLYGRAIVAPRNAKKVTQWDRLVMMPPEIKLWSRDVLTVCPEILAAQGAAILDLAK